MYTLRLASTHALLFACSAMAQDRSPLRDYHVWLPMLGATTAQVDDAAAAGFNAILIKMRPKLADNGSMEADPHAQLMADASRRGLKLIVAILHSQALPRDRFWDVEEDGKRLPGELDPFWPEAMRAYEQYVGRVMDHYASNPQVVGFAPTWGIYGEAGFTSYAAGRSPYALARFNEWLAARGLPRVEKIPSRANGPNTDFNRFIRFRYEYMQQQFDGVIRRLKPHAKGRPVGTWQEMYSVMGYLFNMVRVPSADFALYESCFPFQSDHDPNRTLAEGMGFRYRCASADEFRNYFLPLMARKRGEGQRFMGCQLSNEYAVKQYGWTAEKAAAVEFDRWEDRFSPHLKALQAAPLETPPRDILLVFPTYAAAALSDRPVHAVDAMLIDVLLRMHGCQIMRIGSPRLDELTVAEMDGYKLIIVPASAYLLKATLERLEQTRATVLFTGEFGKACDGVMEPQSQTRRVGPVQCRYSLRPAGEVRIAKQDGLIDNLLAMLKRGPVRLPEDESFTWEEPDSADVLLTCGEQPILSTRRGGRTIHLHGQIIAGLCHDPNRKPPTNLSGSADGSANEIDIWGPYSSSHPQNPIGTRLIKCILDHAGVLYRIAQPAERTCTPYLGDHLEAAGISANIVYNNMAAPCTLTVRLPYAPADHVWTRAGEQYAVDVEVPAFGWKAIDRSLYFANP